MQKRGKDARKFKVVADALANAQLLPRKHRDHALKGRYINHRECRIEPDWLLVYRIENNTLFFQRTGTHSDLFK